MTPLYALNLLRSTRSLLPYIKYCYSRGSNRYPLDQYDFDACVFHLPQPLWIPGRVNMVASHLTDIQVFHHGRFCPPVSACQMPAADPVPGMPACPCPVAGQPNSSGT
jgi:hypothetical protein